MDAVNSSKVTVIGARSDKNAVVHSFSGVSDLKPSALNRIGGSNLSVTVYSISEADPIDVSIRIRIVFIYFIF
jgi:hypothetical protein